MNLIQNQVNKQAKDQDHYLILRTTLELIFVNLSLENFNLDNNFSSRSNRIRPDGKFLCKDIVHQFGMEVDVLEVSKSNSSLNKKERDRIKLILAMLMFGAYLHYNFDSQYMTNSIQTLIEEIGFITL
ncbi:1056_t:CDS:2 [Racocetra persica]|uniref:1056_t:CDS:1 n=1 Tax=Racocetra persica TaxID=160502 RepID=A0ACA9KNT3_9GLOM|nr:1056_t:CDS:2 [Racocetra persica]